MPTCSPFRRAWVIGAVFSISAVFLVSSVHAQREESSSDKTNTAGWKVFANRAGWIIKYPPTWEVGSCVQCADPTDPNAFVSFYDPVAKGLVMIERLSDKPDRRDDERWLNGVAAVTVASPRLSQAWITLAGLRALKVVNQNPDSTESENVYVLYRSKTFAIRTSRGGPSYMAYEKMLSTFSFSPVTQQ